MVKTFIFAAYFSNTYIDDPKQGTIIWCNMLTISGLIIALTCPLIGILVDQNSSEKRWYRINTLGLAIMASLLWFAHPKIMSMYLLLLVLTTGTIFYELSSIFYNTLLYRIGAGNESGRISALGRGLGFLGGLVCLCISLKFFIEPNPFTIDFFNRAMHENIRILGPFVGLWIIIFSMPAFVGLPSNNTPPTMPLTERLKVATSHYLSLREFLKSRPDTMWFMFAHMIYMDGLNTLFATAGIFAMNTFHLSINEVVIFAIVCNVSAAIGAISFSWIDKLLGPKLLIELCLIGMTIFGLCFVSSTTTFSCYLFALISTLFVGPLQAASRTYLVHSSQPDEANTIFSIASLTGKLTAFIGPLSISLITYLSGNPRIGHSVIMLFFAISLIILRHVPVIQSGRQAHHFSLTSMAL